MPKTLRDNQGVTLIELIFVAALMSLIFGAVFSIYLAGQRTFTMTRNQVTVQQDLRRVSNLIIDELAFAVNWEILEQIPMTFDDNYNYIYVENQNLHIRKKGALTSFSGTEYRIVFWKTPDSLLRVGLEGTQKENNFILETEIRKLNEGEFVGTTGGGIRFSAIEP
ncbi:MAG: PilW family protein [Alkaliphilus sp.]